MGVRNPFVRTIATAWVNVQKMDAYAKTDTLAPDVNSRRARVRCFQMMVRTTYHVLDTVTVYTDLVIVMKISPVRAVLSAKET